MALPRTRRKESPEDLLLELSRAIGLDLNEDYDLDSFMSLWVDTYQNGGEEAYQAQAEYLHRILIRLQTALTSAIVPTERKTKVWFLPHSHLVDLSDKEIVDFFFGSNFRFNDNSEVQSVNIKPVVDNDTNEVAFLAVQAYE